MMLLLERRSEGSYSDAIPPKHHSGRATARRASPAVEKGYHAGREAPNKGKTYPAEVLTQREVSLLLSACGARSSTGIRNRALITVLYRAGLRLGEALALEAKDVDTGAGTIAVLRGKGGRQRTVGIDPEAVAVLERWVERRKQLQLGPRRPLFCTLQGQPLKPSYVRTMLPRLAAKAGIEKRVHPHGLRHSHAAELAVEGFPLNLVQQQLGHSSLATTDRYLRHVAPAQLIAAMRARTWEQGAPE